MSNTCCYSEEFSLSSSQQCWPKTRSGRWSTHTHTHTQEPVGKDFVVASIFVYIPWLDISSPAIISESVLWNIIATTHFGPTKLNSLSSSILMVLFWNISKSCALNDKVHVLYQTSSYHCAFVTVSLFSLLEVYTATLCNRLCWNTGRNNCSTQKISV